jgi:hypothetical protein
MENAKSLTVSPELRKRLMKLKIDLDFKSIDELIEAILKTVKIDQLKEVRG